MPGLRLAPTTQVSQTLSMAKKRKAPKSFEKPPAPKSSKFDVEERFDDSEDEFFAGKDKILLDESAQTKRRQRLIDQEKELQPSDEEVLGYEEDDSASEDDEAGDLDDDDASLINGRSSRAPVDSDAASEDEDSEGEVWGTSRADYYGDDVIETEEQAKEEEKEAKRLHQKQLKNMTAADFGFDEDEWTTQQKDQYKSRSVAEKLPEAQLPENATEEQKLQILNSRYPELLPLADEFHSLQALKSDLEASAEAIAKDLKAGAGLGDGLPVNVKRDALSAYLATISMYFAIVSSNASKDRSTRKITAMAPLDLHEHSVVQSLARARQLWDQVKDLQHASLIEVGPEVSTAQKTEPVQSSKAVVKAGREKIKSANKKLRSVAETLDSMEDALTMPKRNSSSKSKEKKKLLDINSLMAQTEDVDGESAESDFGDEQPLTEEQYAEKAKKRKSLRFYTSQLASKANKRGQASRVAGGDDDLPYKERQRDKHERLIREAEKRGRGKSDAADDFDGDDDGYEDLSIRRDTNDEYYDALLNAKKQKKSDKEARADAYARAAKEGATVYEEEVVGADGKRAITYAIAKNKGLAPKRNKDVRNPRVKKRKKYDEKMKKLASMRPVYKGGEGRGGYKGELTGVNSSVVKSIKL